MVHPDNVKQYMKRPAEACVMHEEEPDELVAVLKDICKELREINKTLKEKKK